MKRKIITFDDDDLNAGEVAAARSLARQFGKSKVILLMFGEGYGEETLAYASYGETKALCQEARGLADVAFDAIVYHLNARMLTDEDFDRKE